MSDQVTCERCGLAGKRRCGDVAPEGWHFGTFMLDPDGNHDPGDLLIVYACSETCRDALWTKMAGHRLGMIESRVNVPAELRRVAALYAGLLHNAAQRISDGSSSHRADTDTSAAGAFARILGRVITALDRETEAEITTLSNSRGTQLP